MKPKEAIIEKNAVDMIPSNEYIELLRTALTPHNAVAASSYANSAQYDFLKLRLALDAAEAQVAALRAEREGWRMDALRYRWLLLNSYSDLMTWTFPTIRKDNIDDERCLSDIIDASLGEDNG
jgi:hypothetical protein